MRESYGNSLLIIIMMVFVFFIVCFTAVIVNFAKTFRIKNQVINYVEQCQYGYGGVNSSTSQNCIAQIDAYLINAGYNRTLGRQTSSCPNSTTTKWYNGYCIEQLGTSDEPYYKVIVYVTVTVPFLVENFTLPVSGESRTQVILGSSGG